MLPRPRNRSARGIVDFHCRAATFLVFFGSMRPAALFHFSSPGIEGAGASAVLGRLRVGCDRLYGALRPRGRGVVRARRGAPDASQVIRDEGGRSAVGGRRQTSAPPALGW